MAPTSVRSLDVAHHATKSGYGDATRNAATLAELVSTIPQTWRPSLGAYLTSIYRAATKLSNVQNTIVAYQRHAAEKSFPASIRNSVKDPKIQFSKEYLGTSKGVTAGHTLKDQVRDAQEQILRLALELKKEELATLQGLIKFDKMSWRREVFSVAERSAVAHGVNVQFTPEQEDGPHWSGSAPTHLLQDCKGLWLNGDSFHYRAVAIARSIADRSLVEKTRNLSLKKSTDSDRMDVDSEKPTKELINDSIKDFESRLDKKLARMMSNPKRPAQNRNKKGRPNNPSRVKKGKPQPKKKGPPKKRV